MKIFSHFKKVERVLYFHLRNFHQLILSIYQANCALFGKSTEIDTHVDIHLINNFGYGGILKYPHGGHSNRLKNGGLEISLSLIKMAFIHKFVSQQQLKLANKQFKNYTRMGLLYYWHMKWAYGYCFKWISVKAYCIKRCATLLATFW